MQRRALGNTGLVALMVTHGLGLIADKAAFIGMLVFVFDESGESATAIASMTLIVPLMLMGPIVSRLLARRPAGRVRAVAMAVHGLALGATATAASAGWGVVAVVALATLATVATTLYNPAVAMMSPTIVRDAAELTVANIWVGYASSGATVLAPALATVLLLAGGAAGVILGSAVTVTVGLAGALAGQRSSPVAVPAPAGDDENDADVGLWVVARRMRSQPGATAVLILGGLHYALLMVVGVMAVILAREALDLGDAGPGNLNLLYGVGGLSAAVIGVGILRQRLLTPSIIATLVTGAAAFVALALWTEVGVAVVAIPIIGITRVLLDALTRVMLLRVTHPHQLGGAFAMLQMATGLGGVLGLLGVQMVLVASGIEAALAAVGVVMLLVAAVTAPSIHRADQSAEIPIVEMALLRSVPTFSALPSAELESLARVAEPGHHRAGDVILRAGDPGDDFQVIVGGRCQVDVAGRSVRELARGEGFGEVALLARVPRTATITALDDVSTLVLDRTSFLAAVTGSTKASTTAWSAMAALEFRDGVRPFGGDGPGPDGDAPVSDA